MGLQYIDKQQQLEDGYILAPALMKDILAATPRNRKACGPVTLSNNKPLREKEAPQGREKNRATEGERNGYIGSHGY